MSERPQRYVSAALSPRETRRLVLGRGSYIGDLTVILSVRPRAPTKQMGVFQQPANLT